MQSVAERGSFFIQSLYPTPISTRFFHSGVAERSLQLSSRHFCAIGAASFDGLDRI